MKIKLKLLSCLFFFVFFLYLTLPPLSSRLYVQNEINDEVMVHMTSGGVNSDIELELYLVGVLASEMPASFEMEALKAQAVASRSYVYSRELNVDDTTNSQVYQNDDVLKEKWKDQYETNKIKIKAAVDATKGQVMTYNQEIIHAYFFSSSNGYTNNSQDYWTTPYPYLVSVDSHFDVIKADNERSKKLTLNELEAIFHEPIKTMEIISRYENQYVKEVRVNTHIFTGRQIRERCALSSSSFTLSIDEQGITFVTLGSGHGVGMSQYGAQGMALEGYSYEDILKHYYQGVEIVNK